jgi:hypothetical protein
MSHWAIPTSSYTILTRHYIACLFLYEISRRLKKGLWQTAAGFSINETFSKNFISKVQKEK